MKTRIAVFITSYLFNIWLEGLQIGALTAVFSLQEDFDKKCSISESFHVRALSLLFYLLEIY